MCRMSKSGQKRFVMFRDNSGGDDPTERRQTTTWKSPLGLALTILLLSLILVGGGIAWAQSVGSGSAGVCQRTPAVRAALESDIGRPCADITGADLAAVEKLPLSSQGITELQSGDFAGLTGLQILQLHRNELVTLPEGIFDRLSSLERLQLFRNRLESIPDGAFDGLTSLERLYLSNNRLDTLPNDLFADLPSLEILRLNNNPGSPFTVNIGHRSLDEIDVKGATLLVEPPPPPNGGLPTPTPTPTGEAPTPTPTPPGEAPTPTPILPGEALTPPTGLWIGVQSDSLREGIGMRWEEVPGADYYFVRWRPADGGEGLNEEQRTVLVSWYGENGNRWTNEGQRTDDEISVFFMNEPGDYVAQVQACNDAGCGQPGAVEFTVAPIPGFPGYPSGLLLSPTLGSRQLEASGYHSSGASFYKLRWMRPHPYGNFEPGNEVTTEDERVTFEVPDFGQWVVYVAGCTDHTCGHSIKRTVNIEPEPEPTPAATPTPMPTPHGGPPDVTPMPTPFGGLPTPTPIPTPIGGWPTPPTATPMPTPEEGSIAEQLAPLGDNLLWVVHFRYRNATASWSVYVYDPNDIFSPEMLPSTNLEIPDASEIGELTRLHYNAIYMVAVRESQELRLGYRDRSLLAGVNLIVW